MAGLLIETKNSHSNAIVQNKHYVIDRRIRKVDSVFN
jgi:hypothetical protein